MKTRAGDDAGNLEFCLLWKFAGRPTALKLKRKFKEDKQKKTKRYEILDWVIKVKDGRFLIVSLT